MQVGLIHAVYIQYELGDGTREEFWCGVVCG